jgi:hypothetical protein
MVLQRICPALIGVVLLASTASMAAEYRPDEFLGLDLPKAVLSPTPLGPPTTFAPVPVEANADAKADAATKVEIAKTDHATGMRPQVISKNVMSKHVLSKHALHQGTAVAHARVEKPRGAARTRLAHRRGNPLDAQALDTRIQTWPCNSGGICNWKQ